MAIALVSSTAPTWSASPETSVSPSYPGSISADNFFIGLVVRDGSDNIVDRFNTPSGWTKIATNNPTLSGSTVSASVFGKIATGSESGSQTFTYSSVANGTLLGASILQFSGVDVSGGTVASCLDATTALNNGSSSSPTCSSVTPANDNACIVFLYGADDDDSPNDDTGCPGTAIYNRDTTLGGDCSMGLAYTVQTSAAASGSQTFSLDLSEQWVTFTIALKAAAGGGGTDDVEAAAANAGLGQLIMPRAKSLMVPIGTRLGRLN